MKESKRSDAMPRPALVWRAVRSSLLTLAALALAMGAAACGGESGGSTGARGGKPPAVPTGTLQVAVAAQPEDLDPSLIGSVGKLPIVTALYDGLATRMPQDFEKISPALATSWQPNRDATEWTIKLRRGVTFSDGTRFDAAAAKKTIEYYMRPGSVFAFAVGPAAKVSAPDDSTLVLSYKVPFPGLETNLPFLKMMSPKLLAGPLKEVEKRVATHAAGTGPYILDRFSPGTGASVHANLRYWGDGPHIAKLQFRPIIEESARNAALQAGDIDLVLGVTPRAAQTLGGDPRIKVTTVPSWTTMGLNLATQKKPLDDVRVRQALAYAFDPEAIAKSVLLGRAQVTGALMPPGTYGFRAPATRYAYDPEKAKALLAEAGVRAPVSLRMTGSGSDVIPIGQALVEQAKAAGFAIKYDPLPQGAAADDLNQPQRKYDIYLQPRGWVDGGPLHLAGGFVTAQANYKGKKLLDLIAKINVTPNGPAREQIIGDALEEAAKELPEIPLFAMDTSDASVNTLQDHTPPRDGFNPNWTEQYLAR